MSKLLAKCLVYFKLTQSTLILPQTEAKGQFIESIAVLYKIDSSLKMNPKLKDFDFSRGFLNIC